MWLVSRCLLTFAMASSIRRQQFESRTSASAASAFDVDTDERYIIFIISRLGLGNRMRSIADWYQIATLTNRTLLVSWEATPDCNIKFSDMFEDGPDRLKVLPYALPSGNAGVQLALDIASEYGMTSAYLSSKGGDGMERNQEIKVTDSSSADNIAGKAHLMWADGKDGFVLSRKVVASPDIQVVVTTYDGILVLEGVRCQQYYTMRSSFLSSLKPVKQAQEFVDSLMDTYFKENLMIGVHFRKHDPKTDWEVVPPLFQQSKASAFGQGATLQDFAVTMKKIEDHFTVSTPSLSEAASASEQKNPRYSGVRFFIASNDEKSKQSLIATFPQTVSISGKYDRGSKDGMYFAFLEWLILSRSSLILNTYWSTFALEAAQLRMVPVVGMWEGSLVHHSSIFLPYCGNLLFVKAFSDQGVENSYDEGTTDNRQIAGKAIPMGYCSHLEDWGLGRVLCTMSDNQAEQWIEGNIGKLNKA